MFRFSRVLMIVAVFAGSLTTTTLASTSTMEASPIVIRQSEVPGHFCMLPTVYDAAMLTQTQASDWTQPELDELIYAGTKALTIGLGKDQWLVPSNLPVPFQLQWIAYPFMYPDVYNGAEYQTTSGVGFTLHCEPSFEPYLWDPNPPQDCPDSVAAIASLTHSDPSLWVESGIGSNAARHVVTFAPAEKPSDYPTIKGWIQEVPQGVYVSRRPSYPDIDYDPLDGSDSSIMPGYQYVGAADSPIQIGFILVNCSKL